MNIRVVAAAAAHQPVPGAAVFLAEGEKPPSQPKALAPMIALVQKRKQFVGKEGQSLLLQSWGKTRAEQILLVGLGKAEQLTAPKLSRAAAIAARALRNARCERIALQLPRPDAARAFAEGILLGLYEFDRFKTRKDNPKTLVREAALCMADRTTLAPAKAAAARGRIIAEAVNYTRDIANQPGNVLVPASLAEEARTLAKELGLKCTVFDEKELARRGMNAILAVGAGSSHPPRLITLQYHPPSANARRLPPFAVVGKAITFDSGGLSLKPGERMDEMKWDKCGGCAVLGVMRAVAKLQLPFPVLGIIGAAENMPSGTSYRPGDILKTFQGKTIEVLNTDAEGRVLLADALAWANTFRPRAIVDFATLTGAIIIALGKANSGLFSNDETLVAHLKAAAEASGDSVWQLPLTDEDRNGIKGSYGDIINTGGREAGSAKGAAFLEHFVGKTPWAHLDIAGTAWATDEKPHRAKGATGVGVRLIVELLNRWSP